MRFVRPCRRNWPAVTVMAAIVPALILIVAVFAAKSADAEITSVTSSADTKISENSPTTTHGSATSLSVDVDRAGSSTDEYALIRWDLSSIPDGSKVDSASITLNVTNGSPDTYQIYALKQAWT